VKTDRASMAHSLEARVPVPRPGVTTFARSAARPPSGWRGLRKKVLLRQGRAPLRPDRDRARQEARLLDPAAAWLRGELEPLRADTLIAGDGAGARASSGPRRSSRLIDRPRRRRGRSLAPTLGACSRSRSGTSTTSSASRGRCERAALEALVS
jgi:hypothetical protein